MIPEQLKANSEATLNGYGNKLSLDMQREIKIMHHQIMESVQEKVKSEVIMVLTQSVLANSSFSSCALASFRSARASMRRRPPSRTRC